MTIKRNRNKILTIWYYSFCSGKRGRHKSSHWSYNQKTIEFGSGIWIDNGIIGKGMFSKLNFVNGKS